MREGNCTPPEGWRETSGGESKSWKEREGKEKERSHTDVRAQQCTVVVFFVLVCGAVCGSAESPVLTAAVMHWGSLCGPND